MRIVATLAVCLLAIRQLAEVRAEARHRHHRLGTSQHEDNAHTHSREARAGSATAKEHHHAERNASKYHSNHHAHRKTGARANQALLFQFAQAAPVMAGLAGESVAPAAGAIATMPAVGPAPATRSSAQTTSTPTAAAPLPSPSPLAGTPAQPPAPSAVPTADAAPATTGASNNGLIGSGEPNGEHVAPSPLACKYLWFLFNGCENAQETGTNNVVPAATVATTEADDQVAISPVVSSTCSIYGTTVLSLNDFKETEENGWILISESNTPRITHNKQVNLDKPTKLPLKATTCNAATYEATIKLGVDSIGGFVVRGSDQNMVVFEMNTISKTATLKSINGPYQDIVSDVACVGAGIATANNAQDQINSQFVQKVQIRDTGYKGQIEILIDGRKVISASRMPFKESGYFGLYISQGNATFGDISVVPIKD